MLASPDIFYKRKKCGILNDLCALLMESKLDGSD